MNAISFEYSAWYLLACLALGLGYALILYFRDRTFKEQPRAFTWGLGALRALAVTTLAALLLGPILRSIQTRSEKPVVVIAQDGSESVRAAWSATDSSAYVNNMMQLRDELAGDYEVVSYTFGDAVRDTLDFAFEDKRTNLAALLREIYDLYSNQNLGAVVLASDGIYNEGANPVYTDAKLNAPVYTIGLGDTTRQKDVTIKRVFHNKIAYLGDKFSIQVDLSAQNAAGASVPLQVARITNGQRQVIVNESVNINRNDFFATREFILDADKAGVNRYRITVGTVSGEQSTANNSRDIFVDVLEARQQILLLAYAPHPDLSALKQSMEAGRNNEVEVAYINNFAGDVRDYDLVVLHQLPNSKADAAAITSALSAAKIPNWFILSESSNFNRINELQSLMGLQSNGRNTNEVQAQLAPDFSLFKLSDELRELLPKLPPLVAPFGEFQSGGSGSVMMYQRIGRIDTEYPLFALGEQEGTRQAVLAGTGLWQWRLFDYLEKQNHARFDELVSQVVQYLSVKDDKRRFRVSLAKNIFDENEPIILDAELYNDNYELINEPTATLVITDEEGREFNYTFNATGNGYRLNAGILPVGNYRFRAETNTGTESLNYSGQFSVQAIQLERYALTADHDLLRLLSERYGGALLSPANMNELPEQLAARGNVKPVLYQTVSTRSAINLKWIFFLLLGLLTVEWFLRRYFGAY